jgi:hypothetical protein
MRGYFNERFRAEGITLRSDEIKIEGRHIDVWNFNWDNWDVKGYDLVTLINTMCLMHHQCQPDFQHNYGEEGISLKDKRQVPIRKSFLCNRLKDLIDNNKAVLLHTDSRKNEKHTGAVWFGDPTLTQGDGSMIDINGNQLVGLQDMVNLGLRIPNMVIDYPKGPGKPGPQSLAYWHK